ncbi:aminopeptidase [Candidatus Woesearchaeota archaeon]|nr:aminopeptidase [Candidatus Woesearchaeota archaeon]
METVESLEWVRKNNLYELARNASFSLKNIFTPCLGVQNEKVLIVGDKGLKSRRVAAALSAGYYLAAESLRLNTKLVLQNIKSRGQQADDDVITALENLEENSVVIVNGSDKLGSLEDLGKSFRKLCIKKNFRFVSAMSLGCLPTNQVSSIISAIDINYKPLQTQQEKIKQILDVGSDLHIKTKAGTDLHFNVNGMKAVSADGAYASPGYGGNLPAGEVYIPINGRRAEGRIVIDGSSRTHKYTTLIKKPITLVIEDGSIAHIHGGEEAEKLERTLSWAAAKSKHPNMVRRIGEFGIGVNPKASIIGSTVIDEKTLGTAHIGIGSNHWFGGSIYSIIHLDQVFKDPVIKVDGKKLEI